jgi:phosphoglycerol transferase MdoB-like AlkP superfamily enzyme
MKKLELQVTTALIARILLAIFFFMICRVIFYTYNLDYFTDISLTGLLKIFKGGWVFDLSVLFMLNLLYTFTQLIPFKFRHNTTYQKVTLWFHMVPVMLGIIINISDTVYYEITLKRTTSAIFQQFANEQHMGGLVFQFLFDYWYMLILAIVLIVLFYKMSKLITVESAPKTKLVPYLIIHTVLLLIVVTLNVGGIRGDFKDSTRPITLSNASKYTTKPAERAIVLNTPFALLRSAGKKPLKEVHYFDSVEEQSKYYSAFHSGEEKADSLFKKKNVVLLILESFGREHFGQFNKHRPDYKGFTPFLDSLIDHSYTFQHAFSNGRKSISGMPSCVSSVPSLIEPFILSHYSGNKVSSLGNVLKREGYHTAFFHGAPNGSMGFDSFAHQSGFTDYFGMTEYNNDDDFDGHWGIWDEEFMQYYATEMEKMQEPFFTSLFSVSSHHPFRVPERYQGKFPKGKLPIQEPVGYTDYSLRQFFNRVKDMPWYENSIFVITADHAATYSDLPEYKTPAGVFAVPLIIFDPSDDQLVAFDTVNSVQQIDIMPTILGRLNYPHDYIAFGNDVFDSTANNFAIGYKSGFYHYFKNNYVIQFDGQKSSGLYQFEDDLFCKSNLTGTMPVVENNMTLEVKAFIQEYNRRMINNDMGIILHNE